MARPPQELLDAICHSLDNNPGQWRVTDDAVTNYTSGVRIYDYHNPDDVTVRVDHVVYGGDVVFGVFVPWRRQLCKAARRAIAANAARVALDAAQARARADHGRTIAVLRDAA